MTRKKKAIFPILVACMLVGAWYALPKQDHVSNVDGDIDTFIQAVMEEAAIPGMGIVVIRNGETELRRAYGFSDVEHQEPVSLDTPFSIASISKPILGIAMLQLAERGQLDLDADINIYLPFHIDNPKVEGEIITARHLATHTSGIGDYYNPSTFAENLDSPVSLKQHIEALLLADGAKYDSGKYYLPHSPGNIREYSNLGAGVAGLLVESISGTHLTEFSQKNLFHPLGMTNSGWLLSDFNLDDLAVPYDVEQCIPYVGLCADASSPILNAIITKLFNPPIEYKRFISRPHAGNPQYPDGGVRTSVSDLEKLMHAILGTGNDENVISRFVRNEMVRKQLSPRVDERQRFFWRDDQQNRPGHKGADIGVFTSMRFDLAKKDAVIIVMNRGVDMASDRVMDRLNDRLWSL